MSYEQIVMRHGFNQIFVHDTFPVTQHTKKDRSLIQRWYTQPVTPPAVGDVIEVPQMGAYVVESISILGDDWTAMLKKQD